MMGWNSTAEVACIAQAAVLNYEAGMMTGQGLALLVAALLEHFTHMPARRCIERRQHVIVGHLHAAEELGVPAALMLSVAWHESWAGCHPNEGGGWGAPTSRSQRHAAGTPEQAAHALRWSFDVCGDWAGAVLRFRSGLCRLSARRVRELEYQRSVLALARVFETAVSPAAPMDSRWWALCYPDASVCLATDASAPTAPPATQ